MHFWQKSKKYGWKAGVCFRYQNNKALVPSSPNFMIIAKKFTKKTFYLIFMYFLTFFGGKPPKLKLFEKECSNLLIHIIIHLKKW